MAEQHSAVPALLCHLNQACTPSPKRQLVACSAAQVDLHYNGFCNSVLWQLFHYVPLNIDSKLSETRTLQFQWAAHQARRRRLLGLCERALLWRGCARQCQGALVQGRLCVRQRTCPKRLACARLQRMC